MKKFYSLLPTKLEGKIIQIVILFFFIVNLFFLNLSFDSYLKLIYLLDKYCLKFEKMDIGQIVIKKDSELTNVDSHEIIFLKIFK